LRRSFAQKRNISGTCREKVSGSNFYFSQILSYEFSMIGFLLYVFGNPTKSDRRSPIQSSHGKSSFPIEKHCSADEKFFAIPPHGGITVDDNANYFDMIFYLFQFDLFCRCVIPFLHKNTS
jgi:hypothetical protein